MDDDQFLTFLNRFLAELRCDCDREVERALATPMGDPPVSAAERIARDIGVIAMSTLDTALSALGADQRQRAFAAIYISAGCVDSLRRA